MLLGFYVLAVAAHTVLGEHHRRVVAVAAVHQVGRIRRSRFPDAQMTDEDVIAEGEKVVRRYSTRGTHQGETEVFGPPTGRQVELKGITIHRIEGGKIVEEWESYDNLSMMKQLGLTPEQ